MSAVLAPPSRPTTRRASARCSDRSVTSSTPTESTATTSSPGSTRARPATATEHSTAVVPPHGRTSASPGARPRVRPSAGSHQVDRAVGVDAVRTGVVEHVPAQVLQDERVAVVQEGSGVQDGVDEGGRGGPGPRSRDASVDTDDAGDRTLRGGRRRRDPS